MLPNFSFHSITPLNQPLNPASSCSQFQPCLLQCLEILFSAVSYHSSKCLRLPELKKKKRQNKTKTEKETARPTEATDLPTPMCLYIPAAASWLVSLAPGLTAMVHLSCGWIHLPGVNRLYEEESGRRENTYMSL